MSSKTKSPKSGSKNVKQSYQKTKTFDVYAVISESVCDNISKSNDLNEIESILMEALKLQSSKTNMKSSLLLDFYCTLVAWMQVNIESNKEKIGAIFTAVHQLLENVTLRHYAISQNILELKILLKSAGEGRETGMLSSLSEEDLLKLVQFVELSLVQHGRLLEYVSQYERAQKVLGADMTVQSLPSAETPYPGPLCEAMPVSLYSAEEPGSGRISAVSGWVGGEENTLEDGSGLEARVADLELEAGLLGGLDEAAIASIIREECIVAFGPASHEMRQRIEEIEASFLKRVSKIQSH